MRQILNIAIFLIAVIAGTLAAFAAGFLILPLLPDSVFGLDLKSAAYYFLHVAIPAAALSATPGARPQWAYCTALLLILVIMYACWPLFHIRHFGETDPNEYGGWQVLVFTVFAATVFLRGIFSLERPPSFVFIGLVIAIISTVATEAYVKPGAIGWVKLNEKRYSSVIDLARRGEANEDICERASNLDCIGDSEGRVVFFRGPLVYNGRAFLQWYGFAFDPTGEIAKASIDKGVYIVAPPCMPLRSAALYDEKPAFCRHSGRIFSATHLFDEWYLVYGENPAG